MAIQPLPVVVIGLLGTTLDVGKHPDRWQNWRPSVSICRQPDLVIARFELLHGKEQNALASQVRKDIASVSPETIVNLHPVQSGDPWDFEQVYETLFSFARDYPFDSDSEDYLIHITTGTHVAQICLFLLTESRHLPGATFAVLARPAARRSRRVPERSRSSILISPNTIALRRALIRSRKQESRS